MSDMHAVFSCWLDALRMARDEIGKPGQWCKGTILQNDGARCALGWLITVVDSPEIINRLSVLGTCPTIEAADEILAPFVPPSFRSDDCWVDVASFNDHFETTQTDVVALYDRAITNLEQQLDARRRLEAA